MQIQPECVIIHFGYTGQIPSIEIPAKGPATCSCGVLVMILC